MTRSSRHRRRWRMCRPSWNFGGGLEVDMKFSALSMTSAGGSYEGLSAKNGEPGRILFRAALTPVNAGFSETLSK